MAQILSRIVLALAILGTGPAIAAHQSTGTGLTAKTQIAGGSTSDDIWCC